MRNIQLSINHFIGLFMGFLLVNQSIRAITYHNYIAIFYFVLLSIYLYLLISKYRIFKINFNEDDKIICISYLGIIIYSILTLKETGYENFTFILELIALFFIYIIGRTINIQAFKIIIFVVIFIGFLQSLFLIYDRDYIYSSGINYLLLSLTIGLYSCISLLFLIFSKSTMSKIFFIFLFLIGWLALFQMQSRAVFLVVFLYSVFIPLFIISSKNKIKLIVSIIIMVILILIFYRDTIIYAYEHAVIYERMFELIYNFENEPRFITYGEYFKNVNNFFFTGYGVNGTAEGIYAMTIEKYPHNFILEFISDFGILGFMFSLYFIGRSLYVVFTKTENDLYMLTIFTIYLYYLINFMKSFSIYDSYVLFFSIGLVFNKNLFIEIRNRSKYLNV